MRRCRSSMRSWRATPASRPASTWRTGSLHAAPGRHLAVLACMDARLDIHALLGLRPGDAHVLRNAGGVATDDAIRSLIISQRLLGTRAVMLIHHTECGMLGFRDDELKAEIEQETGRPAALCAGGVHRPGRRRAPVGRTDTAQPVPAPPGRGAGLRVRPAQRPVCARCPPTSRPAAERRSAVRKRAAGALGAGGSERRHRGARWWRPRPASSPGARPQWREKRPSKPITRPPRGRPAAPPVRGVAVDDAPSAEAAQVRLEPRRLVEGTAADEVAEERTTPPGCRPSSSAAARLTASTLVAEGRVAVVVRVLGQGAVLEQEHQREGAQPGLQVGVGGETLEVGRVAAPPPPDGLQQLAVAGPQPLAAKAPLLDQRHHQEVVVAQDGPAVAAPHGDPGRPVAPGVARAAAGEEVPEEDGLDLVLGVGGQRRGEALVVALDVSDHEHRQRHRSRVPARRAAAPPVGGCPSIKDGYFVTKCS